MLLEMPPLLGMLLRSIVSHQVVEYVHPPGKFKLADHRTIYVGSDREIGNSTTRLDTTAERRQRVFRHVGILDRSFPETSATHGRVCQRSGAARSKDS